MSVAYNSGPRVYSIQSSPTAGGGDVCANVEMCLLLCLSYKRFFYELNIPLADAVQGLLGGALGCAQNNIMHFFAFRH